MRKQQLFISEGEVVENGVFVFKGKANLDYNYEEHNYKVNQKLYELEKERKEGK